jgi:hypothetical protein
MRFVFLAAFVSSLAIGCGSADTPPLGGPYGGTAPELLGPNQPPPAAQVAEGSSTHASNATSNENDGTGSGAGSGTGSGGTGSGTGTGSSTGTGSGSGHQTAVDAGGPPPADMDASAATVPTWSDIYKAHLAFGTDGNCGLCHGEMSTASGAYSYLTSKNQLGGSSPALLSTSSSCLSWLGGNMPPAGPTSNASATAQLQAWAAAGAQDN